MNFNYKIYLENYKDLRHFNEEEAYDHWINYGIKEGRKCDKINFNYKIYLENYRDLKHLSEEEAINHWINCGIQEGIISTYQCINHTTHIMIIIHLFHEYLWDEFVEYINNVKQVFKFVNVIITIQEKSSFDEIIKKEDSDFIVLKVQNKGVDVYPFLESIKYIRKENIKTDFILKLHTKISSNPTENCFEWRKDLIQPLTNINNLYIIQHYFKKIKNLGYVGAQKCILPKNYDLDFIQNIEGLNKLSKLFPHLEKDWTDFIGGNIFWISNDVLNQYLTDKLIDYCINQFNENKPPCNLTDKGIYIEYLCERLFTGSFCYDKTNILVNDFSGTQRGISTINGEIDHTYFYQPKVFSFFTPKNIITN